MTSKIAGSTSGNAIIPYSQTTKATKKTALSVSPSDNMVDLTGITAYATAYADSDGSWFLDAEISGLADISTGATYVAIDITGVSFSSKTPIDAFINHNEYNVDTKIVQYAQGTKVYIEWNTAVTPAGFDKQIYFLLSNVPLTTKPTWADANMEASVKASIYVEPATPTKYGLVTGGKLPGDVSGIAVDAGYIGEVKRVSVSDSGIASGSAATRATLSLNKGSWDIYFSGYTNNASSSTIVDVSISKTTNTIDLSKIGETYGYATSVSGLPTRSNYSVKLAEVVTSDSTDYFGVIQATTDNISNTYGSFVAVRIG